MDKPLANKTALITGASRGIGKAIALRLSAEGARIAVAAKTVEPHPRLDGTIFSAVREIEEAGGIALPFQIDIRDDAAIDDLVEKVKQAFGGIDILINNASAIDLSTTGNIQPKKYDLIQDINVRGTFMMCRACLPLLKQSANAHILNLSPPLGLRPSWFAPHLAYTMSKYGMSMIVLGLAEELRKDRIGVNALWPRTTIATAAVKNILGGEMLMRRSRHPAIVADAAALILSRDATSCTGNFFIDEEVLRDSGVTDFGRYAVTPGEDLMNDLFV